MKRRWQAPWVWVVLGAWLAAALSAVALLSLPHAASLPGARRLPQLEDALKGLRLRSDREFVVHVIAADCSCTRRLLAHLLARRARPDLEEMVLYVGDDVRLRAAAQAAGFRFASRSDDQLTAQLGIEAAPLLLILSPQGRLLYAGGYFRTPAANVPVDMDLEARSRGNAALSPLPVYGCAVSSRLKRALDPLGLFGTSR